MAVRIRLRRTGKKKQPQYRVVVAEALGPRDGRFIETIGNYDPRRDPPAITIDEERVLTWLRNGAQPTDTVRHMLVRTGIWSKFTGEEPEVRAARPEAAPAPPAVEAETGAEPAPEGQ